MRSPLMIFWQDNIGEYCCEGIASTSISDLCRKLKILGYVDGQTVEVVDAASDKRLRIPFREGKGTVRTIGQGIHDCANAPNNPHPTFGRVGGWLCN
jgi:hypothetical protein